MPKFEEINRIKITEARDIVVSKLLEGKTVKGVNITSYIRTAKYTGFAKGGVYVPADKIEEFGKLIKDVIAQ